MKIKFNLLAVVILFVIVSITSCGSANKAEEVVDVFVESYNLNDFEKIKQITMTEISELMKEFTQGHFEKYGKIESYDKYNTKIFTNDKNSGVTLSYKCKYSKSDKDIFIKFVVVKEGEGYKLASFDFNTNRDIIDNLEENYEKAKAVGTSYYLHLKTGEIDKITSLLDQKRILDAGNKEAFFKFIKDRQDYYGKITNSSIHNYTNKIVDDLPAFVIIYDCATEKGKLIEEISFVKDGDDFKIYNYRYASTLEELQNL